MEIDAPEAPLEPLEAIKLALLKDAAKAGASQDDVLHLLATMNGEATIALNDRIGVVHVKVDRVRSIGPHYGGGTVLAFSGLEPGDPRETLVVDNDMHKVVRALRENGWRY